MRSTYILIWNGSQKSCHFEWMIITVGDEYCYPISPTQKWLTKISAIRDFDQHFSVGDHHPR
jgi:hypothetical protein